MAKRFRGCKASLQSDGTLEILIYGDIGANWWGDGGITTGTVRQQIDQAGVGNFQKIVVRIDSDGGDAFDGIGIYNVLRAQKKAIDVFVDGLAASAASIIAMAGDTITMGVNTVMLIHNASAGFYGDANYLRKQADALEIVSGAIAQTYVERTKIALKEIQKMLDAETWMSAQECLELGFCTSIAGAAADNPEELAARRTRAQARLRPVKNAACACGCKNCSANNCEDCTVSDCDDLNCKDCPMQASAKAAAIPKPPASAKRVRNATECQCTCENCESGNCDECTNADCSDPNCADCPMQEAEASRAAFERDKLRFEFAKSKSAVR